MKKILCYGDSNTYGYNTVDGSRFDEKTRWTALLKNSLGNGYEIIEEGMCDRTGFADNDKGFLFSSQKHFPKMITAVKDVDIIVLWLGTNDLQFKYNISFEEIRKGLEKLIIIAKNYTKRIILIPPVVLNNTILDGNFNVQFNETSISKSKETTAIYKQLAQIYNCDFFDINNFAKPSSTDGLHYDECGHKIIARKLSNYIKEIKM